MQASLTGASLTASPSRPAVSGDGNGDGCDDDDRKTLTTPRTEAEALGEQLAAAVALSRVMSGRRAGRSRLFHAEVSKPDRLFDATWERTVEARTWARHFFARNMERIGVAVMVAATLATMAVVVGQAITSSQRERSDEQTSVMDAKTTKAALRQQRVKQRGRERPVISVPLAPESPSPLALPSPP